MNAMLSAIKKKRGAGDHAPTHENMESMSHDSKEGHDGSKDMMSLVASLSDKEKYDLKCVLDGHMASDDKKIAQGAPSSEEKMKVSEQMNKQNEELEEGPGLGEDESDDIAKSMLDSRHMRGMATEKPRNLGERMKQSLASKLKMKGKI